MYAVLEVFRREVSATGYVLLKLLRSYLELDMFSSLTVQTETTISDGENEFKRFEELVHVRVEFVNIYSIK